MTRTSCDFRRKHHNKNKCRYAHRNIVLQRQYWESNIKNDSCQDNIRKKWLRKLCFKILNVSLPLLHRLKKISRSYVSTYLIEKRSTISSVVQEANGRIFSCLDWFAECFYLTHICPWTWKINNKNDFLKLWPVVQKYFLIFFDFHWPTFLQFKNSNLKKLASVSVSVSVLCVCVKGIPWRNRQFLPKVFSNEYPVNSKKPLLAKMIGLSGSEGSVMVYDLCAAWIAAMTLSSACSKMAEALLEDSATW